MLRQFRKTGLIIGVCLMIAGLGGCGGSDTITEVEATKPEEIVEEVAEEAEPESVPVDDSKEGRGDVIPEEDSEETKQEADQNGEIYKSVIEELKSSKSADRFELVNIDEDDIPELVASDSEGSYEHDNAFIYTVSGGEPVLLASAVTGEDGTTLCYSEGKNLIRQSGGIAGAIDVFSKIKDGKLEEVFRAEMIDTLQTDANDDEIYKYSINGKDTDKTGYVDEFTKFMEPYDTLISIDYDGLNKIKYVHDQNMVWFERADSDG